MYNFFLLVFGNFSATIYIQGQTGNSMIAGEFLDLKMRIEAIILAHFDTCKQRDIFFGFYCPWASIDLC